MATKEVGGVNLRVTQQKARIAPRTGVALKPNRYLEYIKLLNVERTDEYAAW